MNLLQEEFKVQASRSKKDFNNRKYVTDASSISGSINKTSSEFIDIFKGNTNLNDSMFGVDEDPLTEDETNILKEFEKNDQELEDIAA